MKLDVYHTPYKKIKPRLIRDLNVIPETVKRLEENTGKKLFDTYLDNNFFTYDPKSTTNKSRNKQIGLHQNIIKSFCTVKETVNRVNGKRIFTNHASDKALLSKIYKKLKQLNSKKTNSLI